MSAAAGAEAAASQRSLRAAERQKKRTIAHQAAVAALDAQLAAAQAADLDDDTGDDGAGNEDDEKASGEAAVAAAAAAAAAAAVRAVGRGGLHPHASIASGASNDCDGDGSDGDADFKDAGVGAKGARDARDAAADDAAAGVAVAARRAGAGVAASVSAAMAFARRPPKTRDPSTYGGMPNTTPSALEWARATRALATYAFPPGYTERVQVDWAATFLDGMAARWWAEPGIAAGVHSWADFEAALRARFQPEDLERAARARVLSMRQESGATGLQVYISRFQTEMSFLPDMDEKDRAAAFARGLRPSLHREVLRRTPRADTLQTAIAYAVAEDALEAELAASAREAPARTRTGAAAAGGGAGLAYLAPVPGGPMATAAVDSAEGMPSLAAMVMAMREELAALRAAAPPGSGAGRGRGRGGASGRGQRGDRAGAGLSSSERARRYAAGLCFRCGKAGHMAAACPRGGETAGAAAGPAAYQGPELDNLKE
jgi:hypothetical protein